MCIHISEQLLLTPSVIRPRRTMQRHVLPSASVLPLLCFFFFCHMNPTTSSVDIIDQTCMKCSQLSRAFDYLFCTNSLVPIPVAHFTNLEGLAIISMELALQNATDTVSTIKLLLQDKSLKPYTMSCLRDCLELYDGSIPVLIDSIGAFMVGQYGTAGIWVSGVMDAATTCEDGFGEMEGESSPLTWENRNLFQLGDIALCIIHLLNVYDKLVANWEIGIGSF